MSVYATGLTGTIGSFLPGSIKPINIDLASNSQEFEKLKFEEEDSIIHLGAVVGNKMVDNNPNYAFKVNVTGTQLLAQVALSQKVSRFLYISSSHVYKSQFGKIGELDVLEPTTDYGKSKLEAENMLEEIFSEQRHKLCILRVFSLLDWNMPAFTLGGSIQKAFKGEKVNLVNGDDIRDFLTPKKVAEILLKLSTLQELPKIINICSGDGITVANAARAMAKTSSKNIKLEIIEGFSKIPQLVGDNSLLLETLPGIQTTWRPSICPLV